MNVPGKRSYEQFCAVARALDVVGERWTLLLVRELVSGPRRWSDLLDALPGVGTGLLAARLRELEREGLVARRTLPPPAASAVYELTGEGRRLEPVLAALADFGAPRLSLPEPGDAVHARWVMYAMRTRHDSAAALGVHESYELRLGREVFHAAVEDGQVAVADGPAEAPALVIAGDASAFVTAAADPSSPAAASLSLEGDPQALERMQRIFAPAAGRAAA